jgi:hypothetical protein
LILPSDLLSQTKLSKNKDLSTITGNLSMLHWNNLKSTKMIIILLFKFLKKVKRTSQVGDVRLFSKIKEIIIMTLILITDSMIAERDSKC